MYFRAVLLGLTVFFFTSCGSDSASEADALADSSETLLEGQDSSSDSSKSSGKPDKKYGSSSSGRVSNSSSSYVPPDVIADTNVVEDTTIVTDVDQLPACSAKNEGETFMVNAEKMVYFCLGGNWVPYSTVEEVFTVSCKDGVLTIDETAADDAAAAPAGGYGGYGGFGGYGGGTTVSSGLDTLDVRIPGATIVGIAEKGPFRYGASVKITELDSVQRLADSRLTHTACITGVDGAYRFDALDLRSPYLRGACRRSR